MAQGQHGGGLPAAPPPVPGLPSNAAFYDYAGWDGIDTKSNRAGLDDRHAAWMDNIMPIGNNNLVALNDLGSPTK
jgi:hypothetical protein